MGPEEAALAGLHADALALLTRVQLEAGQANQQTTAQRHQQALGFCLDKRHTQSAIWGKTTASQQRMEQTKLQKVTCCHSQLPCLCCMQALLPQLHETSPMTVMLYRSGTQLFLLCVLRLHTRLLTGGTHSACQSLAAGTHECCLLLACFVLTAAQPQLVACTAPMTVLPGRCLAYKLW